MNEEESKNCGGLMWIEEHHERYREKEERRLVRFCPLIEQKCIRARCQLWKESGIPWKPEQMKKPKVLFQTKMHALNATLFVKLLNSAFF